MKTITVLALTAVAVLASCQQQPDPVEPVTPPVQEVVTPTGK